MLGADVAVEGKEVAEVVEEAASSEKGHCESQVANGRADENSACHVGVV